MTEREHLHRDGYALLRQAVTDDGLHALRAAFEGGVKPSQQWPAPRGAGWRYSQLDHEPSVQAICRLPELLATVGTMLGECFFISQVEGREPVAGSGHQPLHRDAWTLRPGDTVGALVYLDEFGPDNGATRLVPGSHRPRADEAPFDFSDESQAASISGRAGDILVFDVALVHAGSRNLSGRPRRTLMISYRCESLYASHLESRALRNVQMDTSDRFDPSGAWLRRSTPP